MAYTSAVYIYILYIFNGLRPQVRRPTKRLDCKNKAVVTNQKQEEQEQQEEGRGWGEVSETTNPSQGTF